MSTKAPVYLKRTNRKGKKERLRDILSSDMISSPLGDFRHTIHIGSRGEDDVFGDISFLKGKLHLLPGGHRDPLRGKVPHYSCSASLHGEHQRVSPLLKNAISLPVIGGSQPQLEAPPKPPRLHLGSKNSGPLAQDPASDENQEQGEGTASRQAGIPEVPEHSPEEPDRLQANRDVFVREVPETNLLPNAVSLLSLHLDLGPSILDDVLQIMDREQDIQPNVACLEASPRCQILSLQ
ncbi:cdc42 effector protein 2-like [Stegostoma tigrinum]|uniref:cdc42 effector protein 2-like n=1 Tax=Stegostoma tigrinum TaxID=3053191 RepID=UPI00202B6095|nr:cdc42 effector protein 2-like [Stegostoma tigrinum]XP_059497450.1 cdc42 effector protein 2-like [Stegostoma tigrinum]XP_059497451.1 cdc42 effector protein 2-like [Stegostoma tigrinum]XP_059497452.1 cdc42 effector protein 2-like [Stegostoma tigrinum]XP_059497453.1 cdc42 effector protein 2-like [Stegostoma tigrinum]XP_059497454.1 cdc42 effector protein 2-like [Stegostoma tigrinum]XP_059497455.1 cdc42 effector protein 2-like [Stegostoma tigrinum]XP_059497456.1 cdc42 effector protein 2-like [